MEKNYVGHFPSMDDSDLLTIQISHPKVNAIK